MRERPHLGDAILELQLHLHQAEAAAGKHLVVPAARPNARKAMLAIYIYIYIINIYKLIK